MLVNKFPKTFIDKKLKAHREQVLLEQERALLPGTQPYVEEQIREERKKRAGR